MMGVPARGFDTAWAADIEQVRYRTEIDVGLLGCPVIFALAKSPESRGVRREGALAFHLLYRAGPA
jgi:hypothetical protein